MLLRNHGNRVCCSQSWPEKMHFHVPRLAPAAPHPWIEPGGDGLWSSRFIWPTKNWLCSEDVVSGALQLLPQLLAQAWQQLWMSPVPGQLGWERVRLAHHVPAPCSGSLPQQQDEACSHSLLNRCILWAGSWLFQFGTGKGEKGVPGCQGVLIWLDSSQITQAGRAATARPGVGGVVWPRFAKEQALLSSLQGKK